MTETTSSVITDNSPPKQKDVTFNGTNFVFANGSYQKLKNKFSRYDFDFEISKMEKWLWANPERRKSKYVRFIVNWMNRAQMKRSFTGEELPGRHRFGSSEPKPIVSTRYFPGA